MCTLTAFLFQKNSQLGFWQQIISCTKPNNSSPIAQVSQFKLKLCRLGFPFLGATVIVRCPVGQLGGSQPAAKYLASLRSMSTTNWSNIFTLVVSGTNIELYPKNATFCRIYSNVIQYHSYIPRTELPKIVSTICQVVLDIAWHSAVRWWHLWPWNPFASTAAWMVEKLTAW